MERLHLRTNKSLSLGCETILGQVGQPETNHFSFMPDLITDQNVNRLAHFKLEVPVYKEYSPYANLLLMFMRDDGEVVATNFRLEVNGCFSNKVY